MSTTSPTEAPLSSTPNGSGATANTQSQNTGFRKGAAFWFSFTAILVCTFVSALDISAISTALPTITDSLAGGDKFVWVGAAYGLASAAILPLSGRLADAFGRRPVMLASVGLFLLGSAISGAAQNMNMLIAGRTVQGIGSGGILNLSDIIISDLVPLAERGMFMGIFMSVWALASGVGPPVGGALSKANAWRWIFYLNLPLTGVAFFFVLFFLRVRTPSGSVREKLARLDFVGNLIIIIGTTLALIGLTWGGVAYKWSDAHTLATLIIGFVFIGLFFVYEWLVPKEASIPWDVVGNRTSMSGYLGTFLHGITTLAQFYYIPVYFQACKGASPIHSSVQTLPMALIVCPFAFAAGTSVQITQKYRWANVTAWCIQLIGFGLLSTLKADSSTGKWVGYQVITSAGVGFLFGASVFPVLAPLPLSRNAAALAFFAFSRTFAQSWGITIGSAILQNQLEKKLPPQFNAQFPSGVQIAYAAIPVIGGLEEPLRTQVRDAFAASLKVVWQTMIGISGVGLLSVGLMKEVPMQGQVDETYGLHTETKEPTNSRDSEKQTEGAVKVD
ncbi:MFS general substrate transporter [Dichomitus squalens]|uniref:MFS general substrate transporter n=1 Tax=Dichomitus squalens TaxID=114155 RepID=A0A4Q9PML8_9APHY|nr:MFS general substrate transporter [Dichomitus squalens]